MAQTHSQYVTLFETLLAYIFQLYRLACMSSLLSRDMPQTGTKHDVAVSLIKFTENQWYLVNGKEMFYFYFLPLYYIYRCGFFDPLISVKSYPFLVSRTIAEGFNLSAHGEKRRRFQGGFEGIYNHFIASRLWFIFSFCDVDTTVFTRVTSYCSCFLVQQLT
jgi:hypothetical protein